MATFTLTSGPDYYVNYDGQVGYDAFNTWLLGKGEDHFEIWSNGQGNVVDGYWGSDTILVYGYGQATVNAGDGWDYIRTGDGNDIIHGQLGHDNIDAGWGSNAVYGDDGNDTPCPRLRRQPLRAQERNGLAGEPGVDPPRHVPLGPRVPRFTHHLTMIWRPKAMTR